MLNKYDDRLFDICMKRAGRLYGKEIESCVIDRIDWEMDAINNTGCAETFLWLVDLLDRAGMKPEEICLRGNIGGSLIAYLCGILSYNPLDYNISPYFTFGYYQNKFMGFYVDIPAEYNERVLSAMNMLGKYVFLFPKEVVMRYSAKLQLQADMVETTKINISEIDVRDEQIIGRVKEILASSTEGEFDESFLLTEINAEQLRERIFQINFSDFNGLLKYVAFCHDVGNWKDNWETLIYEKGVQEAIACRDDVFDYLLAHGIDEKNAYCISMNVARGNGIDESHIKLLHKHGIENWYIDSCNKIEYLYPKAHIVSEVSVMNRIVALDYYRSKIVL